MPAIDIVDKYKGIQYTGSNSAEIDAAIPDLSIISESGGVLTVSSGGNNWTISTNEWVCYTQGYIQSVHINSDFNLFYIRNAVYDDVNTVAGDVTALEASFAALESTALLSAGVKECPLLIVGNTTVSVDLIPPLPDTSYTPRAQLFASVAALGDLSLGTITVVDTNTVDVVVTNGGLASLAGANILVTVTS